MGTFRICHNPLPEQHIDLQFDEQNSHVDVITSIKGLFDARHFCYSCHKPFSNIKLLCAPSGCLLCRQPWWWKRTGFINFSACGATISSEEQILGNSLHFQRDICWLKLRTQNGLDCHVSSGICHSYSVCPSRNNNVSERAPSNLISSKKGALCSQCFFPVADS